ncbi:MAG: hypothetical protein ABI488_10365, partial [Polyangiaceae bacterium]
MNRRLYGLCAKRLDEARLDEVGGRHTFGLKNPGRRGNLEHAAGEGGALVGVVRTVTATLTSSAAKPIIDVMPIPASTNEMGVFEV